MSLEKSIFKNGSTTYYFSAKFFPKAVRRDVFKLYSFVRVADDYVDVAPQNRKEFKVLRGLWEDAADELTFDDNHRADDSLNERVVKNMIQLTRKYGFDTAWVDSFLDSMQADLDKKKYTSLDGSLWYVYGSAEVIGLMMVKIMNLPKKSEKYALLQGRAMQWINFIRDIDEDSKMGRCYFPQEELDTYGLRDLTERTARANPEAFSNFMNAQLDRYMLWQNQAKEGFGTLPKRLRVALETAIDSYQWVAKEIAKEPLIVYRESLKPHPSRVVGVGLSRLLNIRK